MGKYKHRVNFRLEKRKDRTGDLPINADITFGGKHVWYYTGYRIAEAKWDLQMQRVKRNSFNDAGDSATDINQRLVPYVFSDFTLIC